MNRKLKVNTLQKLLAKYKRKGKTIGFVPTMGALHDGHMSLIQAALSHSEIVVCSIFVNPTQFNESSDLKKYPRTIKSDMKMLKKEGCHVVFTPSVRSVYPEGDEKTVSVDLGGLDLALEGKFRPGHFDGVVQVVHRLLEIVQPDHLYMGQKDFQQFTIIKRMIDELKMPVELVVCPIKREETGLAMSSRNERLPTVDRSKAKIINESLLACKNNINKHSITKLKEEAIKSVLSVGYEVEYFEIIDGSTLLPIEGYIKDYDYVVACVAAWVAGIRLIDNMILKNNQ